MQGKLLSRRHALRTLSAVVAGGALDWAAIARAGSDAHAAAQSSGPITCTLLGPADAADVEALTSQIIPSDDLKNWFIGGLVANPQSNPQSFRRSASETAAVPLVRTPLWYARGVGGSTLHYTANYWRFREIDFRERSTLGEISGTGFADWPISYAELEPYYTKVDWEIGVSAGGSHRALRSACRQLRVAYRNRQAWPRDGRGLLRRAGP